MVDYIIEHWTKIRCRRLKQPVVILMLLSSCRRPLWRKLHGGSTTLKGKPDVFSHGTFAAFLSTDASGDG